MSYARIVPRDLFNEASLLKCLGQLYLLTENMGHVHFEEPEGDDGFDIVQDRADGSIYARNVQVYVRDRLIPLRRPLNSREPWPLLFHVELMDIEGEDEEIRVFNEDGTLSGPMRTFLQGGPRE